MKQLDKWLTYIINFGLKLAIVSLVYPIHRSTSYKGLENHLKGLVGALVKKGVDITILTTYWNSSLPYEKVNGIEIYRFKDASLHSPKKLSRLAHLYLASFCANVISRGMDVMRNADIILFDIPFPLLPIIKNKLSVCGTFLHHLDLPWRFQDYFHLPFANLYACIGAHYSNFIITPSLNSVTTFSSKFRIPTRKFYVIPEGVDLKRFNPNVDGNRIREQLGSDNILLYVGGLTRRKKPDLLLHVVKMVQKSLKDVKLLIIGEGEERNNLESLARHLGVSGSVLFLGYVPDSELPKYYAAADLFVSASVIEGFGLVFVEAMATGKPVVAFGVSSMPEVIGDGGILVPPMNMKAFSEAVQILLTNKSLALQLGEKGFKRVKRLYTWDVVADQAVVTLTSILLNKKASVQKSIS